MTTQEDKSTAQNAGADTQTKVQLSGPEVKPAETKPVETVDPEKQIDQTNAESDELHSLRSEVEKLRMETARTQATAPAPKLGSHAADLQRQRAVQVAGGRVFWYRLPIEERLKALGHRAPTKAELKEASQFFGSKANSAEALRLSRSDPARYMYFRACARELGLF